MPEKTFLIIDGNSILHRAHHALPPLSTKEGELVSAIYGFLLVFFKVLKEIKPEYIAVTFDVPGPTFRHEQFKGYKATRQKAPEEFYSQIPKVKEILKSFSVPIFEKGGYEADDLIGTIAFQVSRKQIFPKIENLIVSGDLDTLQLIDDRTKVYFLKKGIKNTIIYDEEKTKERYEGLSPGQLADYRSLRGDPSDNIPGAPGIGDKTAIAFLKEFGHIENLYYEIENNSDKGRGVKARLREILNNSKEQVLFSKILATIRKDVDIKIDLEECKWKSYDRDKVASQLSGLEFYSLIQRLP